MRSPLEIAVIEFSETFIYILYGKRKSRDVFWPRKWQAIIINWAYLYGSSCPVICSWLLETKQLARCSDLMYYKSFLSYSLPQSLPKAVQRKKAPNGKSTWVAISCSAVRWELWLRPSIQTTLLGSSADWWGQNGETLRRPRKQNMKVNRGYAQLSQLSKQGSVYRNARA